MLSDRLQRIARSFGGRAKEYDLCAPLQKDSAAVLSSYFPDKAKPTVLEIGCGTGFVTEHLLQRYPNGDFMITDIAPEMIARCAEKFARPGIAFAVMDGQAVPMDYRFDLIVIGMAAQWFDEPGQVLAALQKNLKPGGVILYSAPGKNSFLAWRAHLRALGLQDGLLDYPEWPGVVHSYTVPIDYGRVEKFLKSLKEIGANQPREGAASIHPAFLRKACRSYNQQHGGRVEWEVVYGALYAAS